jgi:hypothetical protein
MALLTYYFLREAFDDTITKVMMSPLVTVFVSTLYIWGVCVCVCVCVCV